MKTNADAPRVVILPPVLYAGAMVLGLVLHFTVPLPWRVSPWIARLVGVALFVAGVFLARAAEEAFRRAGTNVRPDEPTTAIVRDGPFRYSRNPLYLATTLLYAGIALLFPALWPLILLVPLMIVLHVGVIAREEQYLESKFGDDYRSYRTAVRRWF